MKESDSEKIERLIKIVKELDWEVIIPIYQGEVPGLIIGEDYFIKEMLEGAKKGIENDIKPEKKDSDDDPTYH